MIRKSFPLYMNSSSLLRFHNLRTAVRLKMCTIHTLNSTVGMGSGFGNELTGSEFKLRYIKFAPSSWVKHPRREADHSTLSTAENKNGWHCTSTHSILQPSEIHFMLDRAKKYGQSHYTALILSKVICRVNSSMGAKWRQQADSISSLVTLQFFVTNEHYNCWTVRTAEKYFPYTLNITLK